MAFTSIDQSKISEFTLRSLIRWLSERTETDADNQVFNELYSITNAFSNKTAESLFNKKFGIVAIRMPLNQELRVKGGGKGQYGHEKIDSENKQLYTGYQWSTDIQLHLVTPNNLSTNNGARKQLMLQSVIEKIFYLNKSLTVLDFDSEAEPTDLKLQWNFDDCYYTRIEEGANKFQEGVYTIPVWMKVILPEIEDIVIKRTGVFENQNT